MKNCYRILLPLMLLLSACSNNEMENDASGTFESVETLVSAEVNGVIKSLTLEEGQSLKAGDAIGYIDSTQLYLRKKQLQSQIKAVLSRKPDVKSQLAALKEQQTQAVREQQRIASLFKANAATQKQLDDANTLVAVIDKQIEALQSSLSITSTSIGEESLPLEAQIEQIEDQLSKCRLVNPVTGTVLTKYAEPNEMAVAGKPLYKIADLSSLLLRAYVTGDQFASIKLGQKVTVLTDDGKGGTREFEGTITWISDKAEFTPKTIQTKDERANLVYATKIKVKNDGTLKIGMYGEVKL